MLNGAGSVSRMPRASMSGLHVFAHRVVATTVDVPNHLQARNRFDYLGSSSPCRVIPRMPDQPTIRIFISSPSDVRPERLKAEQIIARLDREFAYHFRVEAVLWEREPLVATHHFQDAANIPEPRRMDIVVVILWSRLGVAAARRQMPDRMPRRHVREKAVIDHLADKVFEPPPAPEATTHAPPQEPACRSKSRSARNGTRAKAVCPSSIGRSSLSNKSRSSSRPSSDLRGSEVRVKDRSERDVLAVYDNFSARMSFPAPPNFILTQGHSRQTVRGTWDLVRNILSKGNFPHGRRNSYS